MQAPPTNMHAYRRSQVSDRDAWVEDLEGGSTSSSSQPAQSQPEAIVAFNDEDSAVDPFGNKHGVYRRKRGSELRASAQLNSESEHTHSSKSTIFNDKSMLAQFVDKWMQSHWPILLVSSLIFVVLSGAGIALFLVIAGAQEEEQRDNVMDVAKETGAWFAKELDFAILPLFSMAQFATELELFASLPDKIRSPGEPNALPFLPPAPNSTKVLRNVTGVCDQPDLIERFTDIAAAVKHNARMDGILHNIQLAPQGVICLLHPMNNTEDFKDGKSYLDNSGAWGIDLLHDPFHRYIARQSLAGEEIGIVGPRRLFQCPSCGMYFIVRLPVASPTHVINVDGNSYKKWGFTTALINWDALVERSQVHERFKLQGYEFRLTRTDRNYNDETGGYEEEHVVLAESTNFGSKHKEVSTALQTTNNEWVIVIQYDPSNGYMYVVVFIVVLVVAFFISALVYTVLIQKQTQTAMAGIALAEKGKVELERHLTAALAHELRNPLGAIDSALATMPDSIPTEAKELVSSMSLCSNFMQNILNNLLDSRKLEEGKMSLLSNPLSLKQLVEGVHKMMLPAVNSNVKLIVEHDTIPPEKEFVYGDYSRLQQVLTNCVSNSCKYTRTGSITISACWVSSSLPEVQAINNTVAPAQQLDENGKPIKNGSENEDWVQLMCRDTGPGIPKEDQSMLFNRFTTRGGAPGSGLGLAIARQIVDLAGGSIRFESDPTVKPGTDCIVLLPMKVCLDVPQASQSEELEKAGAEDTSPLQEPIQILITDDIKMNRVMLKRRFQKCIAPNCTIKEASTGEAALEICKTEEFDVVIMDQYMQEASGVMVGTDVIIAMRRSRNDAVMIGCSGNDLEDKFASAGADIVWKKPIPTNVEIITSLRKLLRERDERRKRSVVSFDDKV